MACTSDGRRAYVGCFDGTIRVWDLPNGEEIDKFRKHKGCVLRLKLLGNEKTLASAGQDGKLRFWDLAANKLLHSIDAHELDALGMSASADGSRILTMGYETDGNLFARLWDAKTYQRLQQWPVQDIKAPFQSIALSPDGKDVLIADGKLIRVFSATTGQESKQMQGHDAGVRALAFSPDGKRLLSGGADKKVMLWDFTSGQELQQFAIDWNPGWICFSPDGSMALWSESGAGENQNKVVLANLPR
jgi:cytochrome c